MAAVKGAFGAPAFGFIFASALLSAISFSIVIPVLPHLVRSLAGGDSADAAEWMMVFAASWGLAQLVFAPLLGALSDRFGRRPVLLVSSLGLAIDFLFMALAPTLPLFLLARVISGATSASFPTAHAYVADVVPPERRTAAFGKLASAISVGFMVGPALGGWLGEHDLRLPFLVAAAVTLANFLYGLLVLPESLPRERRANALEWRPLNKAAGLKLLRTRPELGPLMGISFLNAMSNMIWGSVWVLFCAERFGWSAAEMGLQIFAAGLLGVGVQALLVGRIARRLGERKTLLIGLWVSAANLLWAAASPNGWWFVAFMPAAAFGLLLGPGLQGMIAARLAADEQGRMQGANQALNGLATIIGPPIYGALFAWSLRQDSAWDLSGLALAIAAAFLVGAVALSRIVRTRTNAAAS